MFQAVYSEEFISLNIWLKAVVSSVRDLSGGILGPAEGEAGSSSYRQWAVSLKGFAFVESKRSAVPPKIPKGHYGFANHGGDDLLLIRAC